MKQRILVAGASGNLGGRIVKALLKQGAEVYLISRAHAASEKLLTLEKAGAKIFMVDMTNVAEVAKVCEGVSCVVSALAGLSDVILDLQKVLLDAAVLAKVPRFIPSDYSLDFTKFNAGENRNLDLRREFHLYLDRQPIQATSIFNGAFADMLTGQMPLILFKKKRILYWGKKDHNLTFTSVQNTAEYTAFVALDENAPRYLRIAGDVLSPENFKDMMTTISGENYRYIRPGGPTLLSFLIQIAKVVAPGKGELYPAYQGMQYMRNMIDKRALIASFDNNRYAGMQWHHVSELLKAHLAIIV